MVVSRGKNLFGLANSSFGQVSVGWMLEEGGSGWVEAEQDRVVADVPGLGEGA